MTQKIKNASNKTLFDAVEGELRNARVALSNAGRYMDMIKESVDAIVQSEDREYIIPLELGYKDESIVIGLKVKEINIKTERELLPI